jgi:hypothetical protein
LLRLVVCLTIPPPVNSEVLNVILAVVVAIS